MADKSPSRAWWALTVARQKLFRRDPISRFPIRHSPLLAVGKGHAAWKVPTKVIHPRMIVYAVGVGLDTTFDEEMILSHRAEVHAFDPTPRAIVHARMVAERHPSFHFQPVGIWKEDCELVFHAPSNPNHVSHSITALQGQNPGFTAPCKRLATLMRELGHDQIDLLKLDIEGAEYAVLEDLVASGISVRALCVEFDETHFPQDEDWKERIHSAVQNLQDSGLQLVAVAPKGNYTFLREGESPGSTLGGLRRSKTLPDPQE